MNQHTQAKPAWSMHREPCGLRLRKPGDWQVQSGSPRECMVSAPQGGAAAMFCVRLARGDLAQWLAQRYPDTEPGLCEVRMPMVKAPVPHLAWALFDYGAAMFQGSAKAVAVRHGVVVTLFIAAAAGHALKQRMPELIRVLDSVRCGAPGHSRRFKDAATGECFETVASGRHHLPPSGLGPWATPELGTRTPAVSGQMLRRLLCLGIAGAGRLTHEIGSRRATGERVVGRVGLEPTTKGL